MPRIFVGVSEFGSLRGTQQFMEERAGLQFLAVLAIVNPQLPASERITFNEAERPRASQSAFWNDYIRRGAPPAVVAARPFTSKHDGGPNGESARAGDMGGPGGRVISDRAHALFKAVGAEYGIHHTGASFRPVEKWHFEYVPGTAKKLASAAPTQKEAEEQDMTARLYHNKKTGEIAVIDTSTGFYWHAPNMAYVGLLRAAKIAVDADPISLDDNQFGFVQQMRAVALGQHRDTLMGASVNVGGQSRQVREAWQLAAEKQAVDLSNVKVTVDEASIVTKVVAGVRGLFQKAGS
jgi:hypothetical protein